MSEKKKLLSKLSDTQEDSFFVEIFGLGIAGVLICGALGFLGVAFWFLYCWPYWNDPQFIPLLMPLRTLTVTIISMVLYNRLSRPRKPYPTFEREWELVAAMLLIGLMASLTYFMGVSDGATMVDEFAPQVDLRRALQFAIPTIGFTLFGYVRSWYSPRSKETESFAAENRR